MPETHTVVHIFPENKALTFEYDKDDQDKVQFARLFTEVSRSNPQDIQDFFMRLFQYALK